STIGVTARAVFLLVIYAAPAAAQQGSVAGRVVDSSGGVVPGAAVVLTNTLTGEKTEMETNEVGLFRFPSTAPGTYSVTVTMTGFALSKVDDVRIEVGQQRALSIELKPGQAQGTEIVVVGAETTPLITTRAERSLVVEQTFVKSIPL